MKINYFRFLSLLLLPLLLAACQGNSENQGNPELCYFLLSYDVADCGDCCATGNYLGFDLYFCDELGNTYTFGPYRVPTSTDALLALPSGHSYSAYLISNGDAFGCTFIPDLNVTIFGSTPDEVCTVYNTILDARPEVWSCSFEPDLSFELDAVCKGCTSTTLEPVDCCELSAIGSQDPIGQGSLGTLTVDVLNGEDCQASVAEICLKADNGTTWTDFNSSAGCVTGYQSVFPFVSTGAPIVVEITVSYNNGCPDEVLFYTIPGGGGAAV